MFTGIIEMVGKIKKAGSENGGRTFTIESKFKNLKAGESIAVEGCCLTVLKKSTGTFAVEAGEETLKKTTLGALKAGDAVNLERAMKMDDRFGGHIVQGHVDGRGQILSIVPQGGSNLWYFSFPGSIEPYIIPKGSVSICGVSLTVVDATENSFSVSLLPYTEKNTTFKNKKKGDAVNLEADLIAKVVGHQAKVYKDSIHKPGDLYQKMEMPWPQILKEGH